MRISSPGQLNASDSSNSPLLDNVVILPDGSVTWIAASVTQPEVIPTVACEVIPEWHPLPDEYFRLPQPQPPDIFVTVPEFAPMRALKSAGHF